MANTEDLKSSEVKPLEGSSPSSGTNLPDKLYNFLIRGGFKLKIFVDVEHPGIEGHPIAIYNLAKFLHKVEKEIKELGPA